MWNNDYKILCARDEKLIISCNINKDDTKQTIFLDIDLKYKDSTMARLPSVLYIITPQTVLWSHIEI